MRKYVDLVTELKRDIEVGEGWWKVVEGVVEFAFVRIVEEKFSEGRRKVVQRVVEL